MQFWKVSVFLNKHFNITHSVKIVFYKFLYNILKNMHSCVDSDTLTPIE